MLNYKKSVPKSSPMSISCSVFFMMKWKTSQPKIWMVVTNTTSHFTSFPMTSIHCSFVTVTTFELNKNLLFGWNKGFVAF